MLRAEIALTEPGAKLEGPAAASLAIRELLRDSRAMAHDTAVRYSEEVTQAQLDELTRGVTFSVQKGLDYVRWTCPRCGAEFEQSFRRDDPIYKFDVETADAPSDHGVLDLVCKCGVKHDGADDKPGCGFAAHLPVKKA